MKNTSLLLGNYGNQPFKLYTIHNKNYYCIKDINIIFLNGKLNTKATLIKQLFNSNSSNEFIQNENKDIFIMTNTLIQIARLFNMYYLAELCKLTIQEIIGNVSEPLFNIIQCDDWIRATHFDVIVERDHHFESLNGTEWIFTPLVEKEEPKISPLLFVAARQQKVIHSTLLYRWLSSSIPDMIYASKVKQQQQAIIETRQRQVAFIIPNTTTSTTATTTNNNTTITHNKRQKLTRNNNYQNIAGIIHDNKFPPSPPSILLKKRKQVYQEYNLNLLATQATQMRGLPISPEISPSPPPFYHQQQRLPSIKVMLSELNK